MEVTLKSMPNASRTNNTKQETPQKTGQAGNRKQNSPYLKGFKFKVSSFKLKPALTLIELLVVIAILGVLASFTSVAMIGHQKQARDAQRKSDLQTFKKAMESAKADCRSSAFYPWFGSIDLEGSHFTEAVFYLKSTNLKYLPSSIQDPKDDGGVEFYYRLAYGSQTLLSCPTNANPPVTNGLKGATHYAARAKLENSSKDLDAEKSRQNCSSIISQIIAEDPLGVWTDETPAINDGFFYVCST